MRELFEIQVKVERPIVVGQDDQNGRRQLIPIASGTLSGHDMNGNILRGTILPGGVDSQVIRPNGICELSARYGVRLDNGAGFYIENNGIRTVPDEFVEQVLQGEFVDPSFYYFATTPKFETYDHRLRWLEKYVFICKAIREPELVKIKYYVVE